VIEQHDHEYRIGFGSDIHPLVRDRKLMLGGLYIESPLGLEGHSDADVVLHSLVDALLGAAGMGDIGTYFPDTEPKFKNADSKAFLFAVRNMLEEKRWEIVNIDVVITAATPRLEGYKPQIKRCIASLLGVDFEAVNIKAKTNNGFGPEGEGAAISAQTAVLIKRIYKRTI